MDDPYNRSDNEQRKNFHSIARGGGTVCCEGGQGMKLRRGYAPLTYLRGGKKADPTKKNFNVKIQLKLSEF